jgi:hypothetical protein
MFTTAVRSKRDLGVLSVSLNALTGHRSSPRRIAAGAQDQTAAGAGAGYGCLSGGCSITPSGDWDSGNPTFALSRGSPSAPPLASGHGHWFSAMLFSLTVLSDSGKASDPEISPLISARCAGDTAVRLMAHTGLEPGLPLGLQRITYPCLMTPIRDNRNSERPHFCLITGFRYIHTPDRGRPVRADAGVHLHRHLGPGLAGQRDLPVDSRGPAARVALRHLPHAD